MYIEDWSVFKWKVIQESRKNPQYIKAYGPSDLKIT